MAKLTVEEKNGVLYLNGIIDEETTLLQVLVPAGGRLILNLAGVKRINSYGVRQWILALQTLGCPVEFLECSEAIVEQANMISNFLVQGRVLSFYAPYFCPKCNTDVMRLFKLPEDFAGSAGDQIKAPDCACEKCGTKMVLDQDENEYFLFARDQLRKLRTAGGR